MLPISSIQFHPWTPPNEGVRPLQLPCMGGCGLGAPLVQKGGPSNCGCTWSASCMLATHFFIEEVIFKQSALEPSGLASHFTDFLFGQIDDYTKKLAEHLKLYALTRQSAKRWFNLNSMMARALQLVAARLLGLVAIKLKHFALNKRVFQFGCMRVRIIRSQFAGSLAQERLC